MQNQQTECIKTKKRTRLEWSMRIALYLLGLFILAFGVSISVLSGLGVSPVSSIPYVLSEVTKMDLGSMTFIVFVLYVLIQMVILKKDFQFLQLLQIACAALFGRFVSLTTSLLSGWMPLSYFERLIMIFLSTVLIAVGIYLYLLAKIVPQAAEGLVQTIANSRNWKLSNVKNGFDLLCISVAAVISLVAFGTVIGLREGTIIAAVGVGRCLKVLGNADNGRLHCFVYGTLNKDKEIPI
jgi:uncharacterized membrane protein YczE